MFAMLDADQNGKKILGVIPTAGIGFFAKLFRARYVKGSQSTTPAKHATNTPRTFNLTTPDAEACCSSANSQFAHN